MTFVEAALEVLRREGKPLHFKDLTRLAVKYDLLSVVGRDPEAMMQVRLQAEVRRPSTDMVRISPGVFGLRSYPPRPTGKDAGKATPEERADKTDKPAGEAGAARPEPPSASPPAGASARGGRGRGRGRGGAAPEAPAAAPAAPAPAAPAAAAPATEGTEAPATDGAAASKGEPAAPAAAPEAAAPGGRPAEEGGRGRQRRRGGRGGRDGDAARGEAPRGEAPRGEAPRGEAAPAPAPAPTPAPEAPSAEAAAPSAPTPAPSTVSPPRVAAPPPAPTPPAEPPSPALPREEAEPVARPEALARPEPPARPEPRPEPVQRPEPTPRPEAVRPEPVMAPPPSAVSPAQAAPRQPPPGPAPSATTPSPVLMPAGAPSPTPPAPPTPRQMSMADAAYDVLRGSSDGRALTNRQVAEIALKRRLLRGEQADLSRALRAALLRESRQRDSDGLRPRIRNVGPGQYMLSERKLESEVYNAERELLDRLNRTREATRVALRRRLRQLPAGAFELLMRLLIERLGMLNAELLKRGEGVAYYAGLLSRGSRTIKTLVAIRPGEAELSREAVGELRAGLRLRSFDEGMVLCAGRASPQALTEAGAAPGIDLYDQDALTDLLMRHQIGVRKMMLPIEYLDADLFNELLEQG